MSTWWQFAMAAVGGGTIASVVNGIMLRRKIGAEAESVTVTTATALLEQMRTEVQRLLERVRAAETAADEAAREARLATHSADDARGAARRCTEKVRLLRVAYRNALLRVQDLETTMAKAGLHPPAWDTTVHEQWQDTQPHGDTGTLRAITDRPDDDA